MVCQQGEPLPAPRRSQGQCQKKSILSPWGASDTDAPSGLQGLCPLREAWHASQTEHGEGLEACLSPDRVETRVNSVAASMLRSRLTCCRRPSTGSGAL